VLSNPARPPAFYFVHDCIDRGVAENTGTGALQALEIEVPEQFRAKSARSRFPPGEVLSECSFPELLERSGLPIPTAPERKLFLANPMGKLNAGQGNGRSPEGLEASR
jgi:hypothetical protein